jgi:two-component system chemotaxis sensor kinase CheA
MAPPSSLSADVLAPIRALFFQECEELLGQLETGLLSLQRGGGDEETIHSVFRAVHSIKGSAGAFELDLVVAFAHKLETVLADLRSGAIALDAELMKLLLRAADVMSDLVRMGRDGEAVEPDYGADVAAALVARAGPAPEPIRDFDLDFDFEPVPAEVFEAVDPGLRCWTLRIRPDVGLYAKGGELAPLLRELQRLGQISVALDDSDIPLIQDLHPERAYLTWTVSLATTADEDAIRDVFAFVEGDCDFSLALDAPAAVDSAEPAPLSVAEHRDEPALARGPGSRGGAGGGETLRVDLGRVDRMVNLVGELLIRQAIFAERLVELGVLGPATAGLQTDEIEQLTRELQDSVMALRAQPVKVVFQRIPRLVRELEAATGKLVDLLIEGEHNEVDRTVIERLADPLIHMVRNAVDHGIEAPEARLAAGKPARGTVQLKAVHRAGRIVIEISDDGGGVNRQRVRSIAVEKGLIDADADLSDAELDALIFAPGFSTATELSDLSGRGVGMDVVKRSVEALGGRIGLTSTPGEGSTFVLSLPLTLAVLDGMAVRVCGHKFVAPLTALVEAVQLGPDDVRHLGPDARLLNLRGTYLPLIDLGVLFEYRQQPADRGVALVVEDDRGTRAGILIDEILGQQQVVIRSLEANYRAVEGLSAATILGDGRVAFILDVHAILASQRREILLEALP